MNTDDDSLTTRAAALTFAGGAAVCRCEVVVEGEGGSALRVAAQGIMGVLG
jgi:hypothetical protein